MDKTNFLKSHAELEVYKLAFKCASQIFKLTKSFPIEERYSLVNQIRRSSRSVCANIAEAFRKRRYPKSFIAKLSDAESEAAETISWLEFSIDCEYLSIEDAMTLMRNYDVIIAMTVRMINQADKWKPNRN